MSTQDLIEQFGKKPGLPLLLDSAPLRKTVARMADEFGYAYWNDDSTVGYWDGEQSTSNWNGAEDLSEAKNLTESISASDVIISEDQYLYEDMDALLADHAGDIEIEVEKKDTCSNCGEELEESVPHSTYYCEDCRAECSECGKALPTTSQIEEPLKCDDCKKPPVERWTTKTNAVNISRAFSEARTEGISKAEDGEIAGLDKLVIEIEENEKVLEKTNFYLLKQTNIFDGEYDEETTVEMQYKAGGEVNGERVDYRTRFEGPVASFELIDDSPESISNQTNEKRVDVKFTVDLSEPEPLSDEETDILAQLVEDFDQDQNFRIQVQAEGITAMRDDE
jgi:ribosomal protein L37AE/L43A